MDGTTAGIVGRLVGGMAGMLFEAHQMLQRIAFCHIAIAASGVALVKGYRTLATVCWLFVGFGGLGAAWSRHTEQQGWLDISALWHRPDAQTVRCAAEHAPFAAAGIWLACRKSARLPLPLPLPARIGARRPRDA